VRQLKSDKGFSLMETLLSTLIGGIVLAGVFDLYALSSKTTQGQSEATQMQLQVKSAMELMAREIQNMYWTTGSPTPPLSITTTLTAADTIAFNRVMASGYSSGGGTSSTLNDTRKTWTANAFTPSATISYAVKITAGTGSGQFLNISGNSATQLTLSGSWGTSPDTTSLYLIYRNEAFTRTAASKLGYQRGSGGYASIADNITQLSFSQTNDSGQSTGGNTASTLNDTTKNWAANKFAPPATPVAYAVKITAGTGSGQFLNISGNSATQLTLSGSWGTLPDATSLYAIYDPNSVVITLTGRSSNPDPRTGHYSSYRLTETILKRN
jgi:type II secretory pathway pseudopilin PulG